MHRSGTTWHTFRNIRANLWSNKDMFLYEYDDDYYYLLEKNAYQDSDESCPLYRFIFIIIWFLVKMVQVVTIANF